MKPVPQRTRHLRRALFAAAAAAVAVLHLTPGRAAQSTQSSEPPPTALIIGRVVDGTTGAPIAGAQVTINITPLASLRTPGTGLLPSALEVRQLSNADGQFAFQRLPAGQVRISTVREGYIGILPVSRETEGASQAFTLAPNQRVTGLSLKLYRHASISGVVRDDAGEPGIGLNVFAYLRNPGNAGTIAFVSTGITDDRGAYRLSGLFPGEYVVAVRFDRSTRLAGLPAAPSGVVFHPALSAEPSALSDARFSPPGQSGFIGTATGGPLALTRLSDGSVLAALTTFHPSATLMSQAQSIVLDYGEERRGVDVTVHPVPAVNIRGTAMGLNGPAPSLRLRLFPWDDGHVPRELAAGTAVTDAAGNFLFHSVPSGNYRIVAEGEGLSLQNPGVIGGKAPMLWGSAAVSVGQTAVDGITLTLRPGLRISGRVQFDGARTPEINPAAPRSGPAVSVQSEEGTSTSTVQLNPDGSFTTSGHEPGRYFVRTLHHPQGWTLRSAMLGATDITDFPIDIVDRDISDVVITLTDRISSVRGAVSGSVSVGQTISVALFSTDQRHWPHGVLSRRIRTTRVNPSGAYAFEMVPAGEYFLIAFASSTAVMPPPGLLERLSRVAARINILEGASLVRDLPISLVPERRADTDDTHLEIAAEMPDGSSSVSQPLGGASRGSRQQRDVPPPTSLAPTARIAGQVLDAATGTPLRRARVVALPERGDPAWIDTDDSGRFAIAVAPGRYRVEATKSGFLSNFHGSRAGSQGRGVPVSVGAGSAANVVIRLTRGAVVSGTVFDGQGGFRTRTRVNVDRVRTIGGRRELVSAVSAQTDDQGAYRVYGLAPGRYVVSALPAGDARPVRQMRPADYQQTLAAAQSDVALPPVSASMSADAQAAAGLPAGFARTFYPGVHSAAEATVVTLAAGQEVAGIDLVMGLIPMARVDGQVFTTDGEPTRGTVMLLAGDTRHSEVTSSSDGAFSTGYAPPGTYTLLARVPPVSESWRPVLWAEQVVELSGEIVTGVTLQPREGATITGRVEYAGDGPPPATVRLSLTAADGVPVNLANLETTVSIGSEFAIVTAPPGQVWLSAGAPAKPGARPAARGVPAPPPPPWPWMLRSVVWNGRDMLDVPLTLKIAQRVDGLIVTVTDRMAEISGRMVGAAADEELFVMVMPADPAFWLPGGRRFRPPVSVADGAFHFSALPAGDYVLVALQDADAVDTSDRAQLAQLAAGGIRVSVGDGQQVVQDIRVR